MVSFRKLRRRWWIVRYPPAKPGADGNVDCARLLSVPGFAGGRSDYEPGTADTGNSK